ncbi:glycosyltransferase family 2 protein [Oribacterium asaccharolyticum]|uniref:glycosyltransferase family 2 protein n=1 Tax=Oribacterium asaccharolyticum TaxID=1501332 RepID=UPI0028F10F5F|nr:glycosyltransferase family 2 protein [Oribacterium asaccharolyticum]
MKNCSIIVSVYNEEASLENFFEACSSVLSTCCAGSKKDSACEKIVEKYHTEILFVDDGSTDRSPLILDRLALEYPELVKVIHFSRNFGHEAAMTAGLDYASGDFLIFMDADLQHSPELIPEMLARYEEGFHVVSMVRTKNSSAGILKNLSSAAFYWVLNHLSPLHFEANASDFFGISSAVQQVLKKYYREKVRYLRGYVQSVGFSKTKIEYEAGVRQGGKSHYSLRKLWAFSRNTLLSFSNLPLKLGIFASGCSMFLGILLLVYTLLTRKGAPSGYATIVVLLCFMFAVLFFVVGIIGEYIALLFEEIKDRPIYVVSKTMNLPENSE